MAGIALPGSGAVAYLQLAFDVASSIDLDLAQRLFEQSTSSSERSQRETISHRRRTPEYFEFKPKPLRVDVPGRAVTLGSGGDGGGGHGGEWCTLPLVEVTLFDFGAVAVTFAVPISCTFERLIELSEALYENDDLEAEARAQVEALLRRLAPALRRPRLAELVEDYVIYRVPCPAGAAVEGLPRDPAFRHAAARVLRAEREPLAQGQVDDALAASISFAPTDLAIIDWNAALVIGDDTDDVLAVLEFANVELLEMRFMDDRLDAMLDEAYHAQQRPRAGLVRLLGLDKRRSEIRRLAAMQVDSALLFEGINNALKLLGDQYLARVYQLTAQRLHLPEWDASILRKLATLEGIYQKLTDQQATTRMEILEIMIIVLFVVSIVLPFFLSGAK